MINAYSERNPDYLNNESNKTIKKEPNKRNFPIYQKDRKKKSPIKPPQKLKTRELFKFLNIWDCEIGKRHGYLTQFNHYLIQKKETIELEEIEKKMKRPDFIRFFKYLQEEKKDDDEDSIDDQDVNLQIAFTAKQRREKNAQDRKKSKQVYPTVRQRQVLLPSSFNPKFEVPQPSPDDFVIVTHFYNSFLEQPQKSIQKDTIASALLENKKFMQAYNMNKNLIEDQLNEFPTQFDDEITLEEFINFVLYPKILIIKEKSDQSLLPQTRGVIAFTDEEVNIILKIYDEYNLDQEQNVNPIKLISGLRTRYETRIKLFQPFISYPEINKKITFEKWLYEFEVYCLKNDVNSLSKSFLKDWLNQLFEIPNKFVMLQTQQISKKKYYDKLYENDKIQLPSNFFSLLEQIFNQVRKNCLRFSAKKIVVDNLFANQDFIKQFAKKKVRNQKTNQLPIETVEDTLNRILLESDEYLDLDELIDFFTIRGRPLGLSFELKQQYKKEKTKEIVDENQFGAINKIEKGFFLVTIPDNMVEENKSKTIRQQKVEQMLIDKEKDTLKEMNKKFQANPVPWYVKEPLYDQLNREREERRQQLKEESKAALMQSMMEPKSFEKQKKEYKKEEEIQYKFLSRPVPNNTNEAKFKEIMEKQRSRSKSNVDKKKAEWTDFFANSSQMQSWEERQEIAKNKKRSKNKNSYQPEVFEKFRPKSLPNFERLHTIFENIIAQRKKGFVPTQPCQTNLSITNRTVDCSMLDLGNQSTQMAQQKIADIDNRLQSILKSRGPNIIKTKSLAGLSSLRRKQRYEKEHNQKVINDELQKWKEERKQLLPKGMIISNPALEQQQVLDKELEDLVKWKKKYHKNLDNDYKNDLKKMQKRVQKRKLLRFQNNDDFDQEDSDYDSSQSSNRKQEKNTIDKYI